MTIEEENPARDDDEAANAPETVNEGTASALPPTPPEASENDAVSAIEDPNSLYYFLGAFLVAVVGFVVRALLGSEIGLSDAEALAFVRADHLALAYFDQPPATAYLLRVGMALFGENVLGLRLLPILLSSLTALILYLTAATAYQSRRAGYYAALLFAVTPLSLAGGFFAAPAALLVCLWLLAALCLLEAVRHDQPAWLLPAGLLAGFGVLTAPFAWAFFPLAVCYLLLNGRHLLRSRWFGAAVLLGLALALPLLIWNVQHHLAGLTREWNLLPASLDARRLPGLGLTLLLALSPGLWVGLAAAAVAALVWPRADSERLGFWFSVPAVALVALLGLAPRLNGPGSILAALVLLFPVLGGLLARTSGCRAPFWLNALLLGPFALRFAPSLRRLLLFWILVPALLIDLALSVHALSAAAFPFFPEGFYRAERDFSNEWQGYDEVVRLIAKERAARPELAFVAAPRAELCAQLAFALRAQKEEVLCLNAGRDLYDYLSPPALAPGRAGLIVTDERSAPDANDLYACEGHLQVVGELPVLRGDYEVRRFKLWLCARYVGLQSTVGAPAPVIRDQPAPLPPPSVEPVLEDPGVPDAPVAPSALPEEIEL